MPEPRAHPNLYTIPPSAPFLSTLARAILAGDLPCPGGAGPSRLVLPQTTIYLPTRRAARGLREAFLAEAGGDALLLPRIRALGQADEDAALILDTGVFHDADSALGAQAIDPLARLVALMRLILAWAGDAAAPQDVAPSRDDEVQAIRFNITPAQAASLAADLASLMDFVESEEVDFAALETLVPGDLASHWAVTVDFLKIVTEYWPRHLEDNGLVSPVARRNFLMAQEMKRLAAGSPFPVIAAGSTGTVPATARLLETIANMPNGAVVLPGLDFSLDEESWARLGDHPEHPQAGMAELLRGLEVARKDIAYVPGAAPDGAARARLHLVSETLRPAETTAQWQTVLEDSALSSEGRASFANALAGLCLVEAPTAHDEAEAIALVMRSCINDPGKTAALVTPDRVLARRVAARLKGFGLEVDDSAGVPVQRTMPGAFLDLVIAAVEKDFAPPELMALLKHPLTRVSRSPASIRAIARALERGVFRDVYLGQGFSGIAHALSTRGAHARITDTERAQAQELVRDLQEAFAPLTEMFGSPSRHTASTLAEAHAAVAEILARDEADAMPLWNGDAGEALTLFLSQLIEGGTGLRIDARSYPALYRNLLSGQAVRPRGPAHPRLSIWGQLEARLQQPDVLILGSLNEGVWPRPQEAGPWLSRPMRAKLGLSPPERRIGLSAHDFAQALGAKSVFLTRALKVDGVPTVPSRWVQRLQALVSASGLSLKLAPEQPWVAWARMRDAVETFKPVCPPRPCPPVAARPKGLSVTQIERWIANPYEIYARHILKLEPLGALGAEPDAAMRGTAFHRILNLFAAQYPEQLPDDIDASLNEIAAAVFDTFGEGPSMRAFWRPSFRRFARWFAATEPARRSGVLRTHAELKGTLELPSGFRLTARADRIDELQDQSVVVYDYKTGSPPSPKHVTELFAPQLPLEAAIAAAGGFAVLGSREVSDLVYIHASGRQEGGEERQASTEAANTLAARALENLTALVAHFQDPDTPYEVKRRAAPAFASVYRYDDYEHLARVQEWMTEEEEEDRR